MKKNHYSFFFLSLSFIEEKKNSNPIKITLALSLVARRLRLHSSNSGSTLHRIMLSGSRRENVAPASAPAEKKLATMATKSTSSTKSASPAAEEFPPLRVKKLVPNALLPVRGSAGAAGYDLAR